MVLRELTSLGRLVILRELMIILIGLMILRGLMMLKGLTSLRGLMTDEIYWSGVGFSEMPWIDEISSVSTCYI